MKKQTLFACAAALLLIPSSRLVSQTPQPAVAVDAKVAVDPKAAQAALALGQSAQQLKQALQALQAAKAANQQLIEKQQKSLELLDGMQKESDQIRILGRRS